MPVRPQEIVERALAGPVGAGRAVVVTRDERGGAALGELHDDHERPHHRAAGRGGRPGGRRGRNRRRASSAPGAARCRTPPRSTTWSRRPATPPAKPGRRATSRCCQSRTRTTRRGTDGPAETSIGVFARLVDGPRRRPGRPAAPLRLRLATTSPPSGSAPRRACAGGGCSRRARSSSTSRPRTSTARRGRASRPPTSPTSTSSRWRRRHGPAGLGRAAGERCPPAATRRSCRRPRCRTCCCMLAWSMDGRPAQEGRSAFAGPDGPRVGERLTDRPLTLASDPAARRAGVRAVRHRPALGRRGERVRQRGARAGASSGCAAVRWTSWPTPRAEAAEFGTEFAPPGDNLLLTGGSTASLADMVARTRRGLLLTCLWYIREVDPATLLLTGLTRDGVYLVENGEVVAEVDHNFRFNHSPLDVAAAGDRGRRDRAHAAARVEGLVHPGGHAPDARAGAQHVVGVPEPLTSARDGVPDPGPPGRALRRPGRLARRAPGPRRGRGAAVVASASGHRSSRAGSARGSRRP